MSVEIVSKNQTQSIIILFLCGIVLAFGCGVSGGKDAWLCSIIALIVMIPMIKIYVKFLKLYPGENFFRILELIFGKIIGKFISFIFVLYALHFSGIVFLFTLDFINIVGLAATPTIVIYIILTLLSIWILKEGIEVFGRWCEFFLIVILIMCVFVYTLMIPNYDFDNLKPFMEEGIRPIIDGTISALGKPYSQLFFFAAFIENFKRKNKYEKTIRNATLIAGVAVLIITVTNVLALGTGAVESTYFPTYAGVRHVRIGTAFQRVEAITIIMFIAGEFVRLNIGLLFACKGIEQILEIKNYRTIVTPVVLMALNINFTYFESAIELYEYIGEVWEPYTVIIGIILPLFIYFFGVVKKYIKSYNTS